MVDLHISYWPEDQEGADDWQWGTPAGLGGDPDAACQTWATI